MPGLRYTVAEIQFNPINIGNLASGGAIGTAAATVNIGNWFNCAQTTASQTLSLPNPTDTTSGKFVYVMNTGSQSFTMHGATVGAGTLTHFGWSGSAWVKVT